MEIVSAGTHRKKQWLYKIWLCIFMCVIIIPVAAQKQPGIYTIRDGKMYIELNRNLTEPAIDSFIHIFNLEELGIKSFIRKNLQDSLIKQGWTIEKNGNDIVVITKPLVSSGDINNPAEDLVVAIAGRFPPVSSDLIMGYNKFGKNVPAFEVKDSLVRFFLKGHLSANRVTLAGSFNDFSPDDLPMTRTTDGWFAQVPLQPGKYWYKFVADGKWLIDEDNRLRENDGRGNTNAVYYKTNITFTLAGFENAKRVFVAGSFNNWQPKDLAMFKTATGWELPVYLSNGTYTYRYIVDGEWMIDPGNPDKVPNEFNDYNSVIKLGDPFTFRLTGYEQAKEVMLMGNFNNWQRHEHRMNKTEKGWELPYTLGPGNYEYRFVVDGTEMPDPSNPLLTNNDRKKGNSILIIGANYTFKLKGYSDAQRIILAGDFNGFNETAYVMKRTGDEWTFTVYLSPGKHLYKFIVDGKWILDPANKLWEQNEFGTGNSVLWIEVGQ
ncbi:MAG: hypothetical protein JST81_01505 [Bacteroidetes bacterium]|nr:hypothetical protein [Bacteroidota bacterium]